ncbi:MAG: ATP-dependent DNA helicase RecG, partial [Ferruginibacter sp.]
VNVPNASVMLVESAERFGLSQLHQLRGRVGRGAEKSFCILLTGQKVGKDARERMQIMETTNDGFLIAEKDLELRGPGQIDGTRQSGALDFKLASIVNDKEMLEAARNSVEIILELDPELVLKSHERVKQFLLQQKAKTRWSKVG